MSPSLSFSLLTPADAPVAELHDLFCKKLQQCCVLFDFLDCVADLKGKEIKRAALNELVESVATSRGVLIEPLYPEAIKMVGGNGDSTPIEPGGPSWGQLMNERDTFNAGQGRQRHSSRFKLFQFNQSAQKIQYNILVSMT